MKLLKSTAFTVSIVPVMLWTGAAVAGENYPEVTRAVTPTPIVRLCTQLEMSAGIERDQCGTLPLSAVAKAKFDSDDD